MNTEITETCKGWVFYDGECSFCRGWIDRTYVVLVSRGLHPVPMQAAWAKTRLGLKDNEPLTEMKFLTGDGFLYGGADALLQIARRIWWAWPAFALAKIPGVKPILRALYRRVAARRYCLGGKCKLPVATHPHTMHGTRSFFELP